MSNKCSNTNIRNVPLHESAMAEAINGPFLINNTYLNIDGFHVKT